MNESQLSGPDIYDQPPETSRLRGYFFPMDTGLELGSYPIPASQPTLSFSDQTEKAVLLALLEPAFLKEIARLPQGTAIRLFYAEAKVEVEKPFQPTFDHEAYASVVCDGNELIRLREESWASLYAKIMKVDYSSQEDFIAGLEFAMTVSGKAMDKIDVPTNHADWIEEMRIVMQYRHGASNPGEVVLPLSLTDATLLARQIQEVEDLRRQTADAQAEVERRAAALLVVPRTPLAPLSPPITNFRVAVLDTEATSLRRQLEVAQRQLNGELPLQAAGGGAAHGLLPPARSQYFNSQAVAHEPVLAPGAIPERDGHKTIFDNDGRRFRVLQLVVAYEAIRTTYFLRRVHSRQFLDACVSMVGDCIHLDMGRATRLFENMCLGNNALGRAPLRPFDWCPRIHAAQELSRLSVIRTPRLCERWLKGNLCDLRHFTESGAEIVSPQWNRLLESLRNFQKLLDLFGPHFNNVLTPLLEDVGDGDVHLRSPLNWVLSLIQGRLTEWLEILRAPTYRHDVRAAEGYPPDLCTNAHAAQLLAACTQGVKAQALDNGLKDIWQNLHDGRVMPLLDNPLDGGIPPPPPYIPPLPPGGVILPAVLPGRGHNGAPPGRAPRRPQPVEAMEVRMCALEARLLRNDRGGGGPGTPPMARGRGRGRGADHYGSPGRGRGRDQDGGRGPPAPRVDPVARRDAAAECHRLRMAHGHLCTDNLLFVCGAAARDCRSRLHQYDPCPYQHIDQLAGSGVTAARVAAEWTACALPNRICTQPKRALILHALP